MSAAPMTGTIVQLDARGFGFVQDADGGRYFFHAKAFKKGVFETLTRGQHVTFVPVAHPFKGPRAGSLTLVDASTQAAA